MFFYIDFDLKLEFFSFENVRPPIGKYRLAFAHCQALPKMDCLVMLPVRRMLRLCVQMPVLFHGKNVVPDSSAIVEYLFNTYPSQMAPLIPTDPVRCAPHAV